MNVHPQNLIAAPRRVRSRLAGLDYGWWVAVAGGLAMALTSGPFQQGSSALFSAVEDETHWSRALITGAASAGQLGRGILAPLQGFLVDKLGPGRMVLIGLSLAGTGAILLSRVHGPLLYYATFLMIMVGVGLGAFLPSMTAVNAWLPQQRARGMSFVMGGSSTGAILVPVLALGISTFGWRTTFLGVGVTLLIAAPILAKIMSRHPPSTPAARRDVETAVKSARRDAAEFSAREALRTRTFWALSGTHTLANLSVAAVAAHIILHLRDVGMSLSTASTILPVMGACGFAAQITGGLVGDHVNKRFAISGLLTLQAGAVFLLAFVTHYWMAVIFAVMWGTGFGARGPMLHALRGEYFGRRSFGTILGFYSFPLSMGMMASPVVVGWLYDAEGTYRWAFIGLSVAALCAALLILTATKPNKRAAMAPATTPGAGSG